MTEVFIVNATPLFDAQKCSAVLSSLSGELYVHIKRKKITVDRARSLAGYLILAYGARKAGYDFSLDSVSFDANGKPFQKSGNMYFSLSHAGEYAVCAISDRQIGIDIEEKSRVTAMISRRFLDGKGVEEWTRREAKGKFTGNGFTESAEPNAVYTDYDFEDYHITVCAAEKTGDIVRVTLPD